MNNENGILFSVSNLISLCHILDDFEEFNKNAITFFSGKNNIKLLNKLVKITDKEFCFNSRKVKKFYSKNKKVIDEIKKYSYIWNFFYKRYCWDPKYNEELIYMYQYIKENREDLDKIIKLLEKIKELELDNLYFNKDFDFTNETYTIDTNIAYNSIFTYLNNLEVIPNYDSRSVQYKTNGSDYKIECRNKKASILKSSGSNNIKLSSLTIKVEELPDSLDSKEIFNKLLSLRDDKKDEYNAIRSSVDLNIKLEDMIDITNWLGKIIEEINNTKTKEELKKTLSTITQNVTKMKEITDNYDKENIGNIEYITADVLEKEKQLEKGRIFYATFDVD